MPEGGGGAPQALSLPAPKGSPYFQSPAWPDHSREQNYFCWGRGEHTSYFKQLQTPGIWVSEFLNCPPTSLPLLYLPEQSQPVGEPGPEGDAGLELSSWGAGQPPLWFPPSCHPAPRAQPPPGSSLPVRLPRLRWL